MPAAEGQSALDIRVTGRVQGVGFRYRVMWAAQNEDLTGWVFNEDDGSVSLHVEGADHRVEAFMRILRGGFPGVHVARLEVSRGSIEGFTKFRVRY